MLEQRRVDYLKAMGITLWMPRKALPHAKASRWIPEEKNERHEHIAIKNAGELSRPVAAADLLRAGQLMHSHIDAPSPSPIIVEPDALTSNAHVVQASNKRDAQLMSDAPAPVRDMSPPRFTLEFIPVSRQGLWVIDASQSTHDVQQFAYRVLKGMAMAPDFMSQPIEFRWPFIESSHQDQSQPVALQALQAQWQFFKSQGTRYIITIGDEAQRWMSNVEAQSHCHIHSFLALQNDPQLKRQLWLSLRQIPEL